MKTRPTIAIVVNTSWNIFNFRMNIVSGLVEKGYRVLCIAPRDAYSDLLISDDVSYIPVTMENRGVNPIKDIFLCFQLLQIFRKYKPDAILQFTIKPNVYGTLAAHLCRIPVINNVSGLGTVFLNDKLSSKIARVLYKVVFKYPYKVFFQNQDDLNLFVNRKLINAEICQVIPGSGVNLQRYTARTFERQEPFVFLMTSRLIYDKGLIEYLQACLLVKQKLGDRVQFWLKGAHADSEESGIVKDQISKMLLDYPVAYLPFNDQVEESVIKADVVVLPSYREGLSRSLLEAAAMGKPLIATDVPGCREIVRNEVNGLLCRVKDAQDLSRVMIQMFEKSDEQLRRFSEQSRTIVEEEFSDKIVTEEYLSAVEKAIQLTNKK